MAKISRTYHIDEDVAEQFAEWNDNSGLNKGVYNQLGMWIVMHLPPGQRDAALKAMQKREPWYPSKQTRSWLEANQELIDRIAEAVEHRQDQKESG